MARNIFEPPPELPPEDIRGGLANWFTYTYYDSRGNLVYGWGSGIGYDDGSTLLQMMGVSSVDDVPEFIENASPEQLRTLYAYKAAVENTENWNDLSNEEKNAILEEAGLGSPFGDGAEYAEGDQVAWEDMTEEERNAHAVRRYETTGETNPWYDSMSQDEIDAAYEYLKTDGNPGVYGTQDGVDYGAGGDDTGPEPAKTLGDLLDELAAEEEVDRDVLDGIVDIIETVKGSIPTDPESAIQTVKDILGSTILGSALEECEGWTGTTTTDNGTVVPSWTKCVDVGIFGIPGLDLPLPPGMIDISTSVYDIIEKAEDIGQSFEDFINDPTGWLEDLVDKAVEKVQDIWGDITGAIDPKSTGGLLDILNDWLGNVLGGYILSQVKEKTEVLNPFLYAQDCSEEGFAEPYEGYCEEAGAINCESQFNKAGGIVLNAAECGECLQEGFKDFGNGCEPVCQYDDSIPASNTEECKEPWQDDGPTAEQCKAQNRSHVAGNAETETASTCGECLSGFEEVEDQCQEKEDPIENQGPTAQECADQNRDFNEATDVSDSSCGPCLDGFEEDRAGNCVATPTEICEDPNSSTFGQQGECGPCKSGFEKGEDGTCVEVTTDPACEDPNAVNFGEIGECGECKQGFKKGADGVCVAGPDLETCQDGSTPDPDKGCKEDWCDDAMTIPKNEDGSCPEGPVEECVKPDGTPTGATVESGCEECPQGQAFNENGVCVGVTTETCSNGATNYPLCTECADGSTTDPNTPCGGDPECNDCTCAEYAAKNPQECGTTPNLCDDAVYASENPLECGWVECPDGSFAPTQEQCGGGCPEGQEPCEALGGECTTPENCPGGDDGGGGGGGGAGMFTGAKPVEIGFDIAGDPQLLARQEFPITDYLAGLFKGIV